LLSHQRTTPIYFSPALPRTGALGEALCSAGLVHACPPPHQLEEAINGLLRCPSFPEQSRIFGCAAGVWVWVWVLICCRKIQERREEEHERTCDALGRPTPEPHAVEPLRGGHTSTAGRQAGGRGEGEEVGVVVREHDDCTRPSTSTYTPEVLTSRRRIC
jgi:hypothetical protein